MRLLALAPETRSLSERGVRCLAWKILYANHRPSLGPETWERLAAEAGGPDDVKRLSLDDSVPMEPFTEMVSVLGEKLAEAPDEGARRVGRSFARRWASMYQTLVDHLEGRPDRMLEVAIDEVLPWFFEDTTCSLESLREGEAAIEIDPALSAPFQAGLVEGFLAEVGVSPTTLETREGRLEVTWSAGEPESPNPVRVLAEATRARFLTATLVPVLAGLALASVEGAVSLAQAGTTLVAAAALHLSANLLNDVYDHRRGVDEANLTPTPFSGGSRVIQRGLLGSRRVLALAVGLAALGVGLGLALAWQAGPSVAGLGVAGVLLGYAYSGDPVRLSHRGLGEVTAGLVFGPLIAGGAYAVQTGTLTGEALLVGVPVGFLMAGLLTVNELPDARWDERTGKHTLAVRLGEHAPKAVFAFFGLAYLAVAVLAALGTLAWPALVAWATAPLAWHVCRGVASAGREAEDLVPYQSAAFWLHASTGLLVAAGVAAGGLL